MIVHFKYVHLVEENGDTLTLMFDRSFENLNG